MRTSTQQCIRVRISEFKFSKGFPSEKVLKLIIILFTSQQQSQSANADYNHTNFSFFQDELMYIPFLSFDKWHDRPELYQSRNDSMVFPQQAFQCSNLWLFCLSFCLMIWMWYLHATQPMGCGDSVVSFELVCKMVSLLRTAGMHSCGNLCKITDMWRLLMEVMISVWISTVCENISTYESKIRCTHHSNMVH